MTQPAPDYRTEKSESVEGSGPAAARRAAYHFQLDEDVLVEAFGGGGATLGELTDTVRADIAHDALEESELIGFWVAWHLAGGFGNLERGGWLRWGEVAGIRVRSIDALARRLTVSEAVVRDRRGRSMAGPPKSQAGNRALALPDTLAEELGAHMASIGSTAASDGALLFPSTCGGPMSYSNFRQRIWLPAVEAAGLPGVNFHDLRRTNASIMVARGVDVKTAQRRLGHSDVRLTLELYAQATSAADRTAADALAASFSGVFGRARRGETRDRPAMAGNRRRVRRVDTGRDQGKLGRAARI